MTHTETLDASASKKSVPTGADSPPPTRTRRAVRRTGVLLPSMQLSTAIVGAVRKVSSPEEGRSAHTVYCAACSHHQGREIVRYSRIRAAQCSVDPSHTRDHWQRHLDEPKVSLLMSRSCRRRLTSKSCARDGVAISGSKVVMAQCTRAATCKRLQVNE